MDEAKFREMHERLLVKAAEAVIAVVGAFYPNCDLTVRGRAGKKAGVDLRVVNGGT